MSAAFALQHLIAQASVEGVCCRESAHGQAENPPSLRTNRVLFPAAGGARGDRDTRRQFTFSDFSSAQFQRSVLPSVAAMWCGRPSTSIS